METERILVCTDGSRASMEAARVAIDLARRWQSDLRVIYVIEQREAEAEADADARLEESARAILERITALAAAKRVRIDSALLKGVPFDVILEDARSWKADLIVMGRTGRTGPGRALVGTEAERVLEFSDRPVLIVPQTEAAELQRTGT